MIHINHGNGKGEWLTADQLKEKYPELHEAINAPRPFNEGGEKIKKLRKKYDMTLRELSQAAGIKLGELSAIETGRKEATSEQIMAIQIAFQNRTRVFCQLCGAEHNFPEGVKKFVCKDCGVGQQVISQPNVGFTPGNNETGHILPPGR